jgi:hypothetical protein
MAGPGGYRAPANPAPVSGPGALSQRTDGRQPIMDLPDAGYGENAQFRQDQAGAALPQSNAPSSPAISGAGAGPAAPPPEMNAPQPLSAGTLNPDQPVTHGADAGDGPGLASLNLQSPVQQQYQSAHDMITSLAMNPNASPALQYLAGAIQKGY